MSINGTSIIKKILIFVNNIFKGINIAKYLKSLFFAKLYRKIYQIIQTLYFILEMDTKTILLKNFPNRDMQIMICINITGIDINIPDIKYIVQWKLAKHPNLAIILQQFKCIRKKQILAVVREIFVNNIYILLKNMKKAAKKFAFACLLIKKDI